MSIRKLLLKSITGRPLRSLALLFICAIMSGAVYGGAVVWASLDNGISSLEKRLGADIIVVPKSAGEKTKLEEMLLQGTVGYFYMDKSVSDELDKIDGVEKQSSQYFLVSANSECCSANVLSGGELRRHSLARALVNSPCVIFADEPTNDLDDESAKLVVQMLHASAQAGAAAVIVTHELFARSGADVVLCMQNSSLVREKG